MFLSNHLRPVFEVYMLTTRQLRLTLPSRRRMQQCRHRFPTRNLPHLSRRRYLWLVPPTRSRIHRRLHPRRPRIRPRSTLRRIPCSSPAAKNRPGRPFPHHHRRLLYGTGLHDRRLSSHFRLC
jgi:hypothetical protein